MSRGPGAIERALEALFRDNPQDAYTTTELAKHVYPGVNRVEKKHRVSIMRAAVKVAARLIWVVGRQSGQGGELVFYNGCDPTSYELGGMRARSRCSRDMAREKIAEEEKRDDIYARVGQEIRRAYIEANNLARDGRHDEANAIRSATQDRYKRFG